MGFWVGMWYDLLLFSYTLSLMIDNIAYHDTPEGTTLEMIPVGFVPRLGAWLIDFAIRLGVMVVASWILSLFMEAGRGIFLLLYFVIDWLYMVLFEVYRGGQTIGKKQYGIKVCTDDGMAMTWRTSMTRNILRVADFLPFMFICAVLCMLFNRQSKRLGDMVAGTMVVYVGHEKLTFDIPKSNPVLPTMPLLFDEQQAVLAFAERTQELPKERWLELAQILKPLTHQSHPEKVGEDIVGFANAIIGRTFDNQIDEPPHLPNDVMKMSSSPSSSHPSSSHLFGGES